MAAAMMDVEEAVDPLQEKFDAAVETIDASPEDSIVVFRELLGLGVWEAGHAPGSACESLTLHSSHVVQRRVLKC
jgi:hypothetical protein